MCPEVLFSTFAHVLISCLEGRRICACSQASWTSSGWRRPLIQMTKRWIAVKFGADVHGPPEESLPVIIWLVFLCYRVKYLRTGKIDRHKISWKHLWFSDDVSWWLCWSEMLPISVVEHQEPKYIMTLRAVVTKHTQKKLFERKNDELKVKLSRAHKLKLDLTGSFTTSSVLSGRCCPMFCFSPATKWRVEMAICETIVRSSIGSPSHVRQPQGEANAARRSSSSH